MSRSELHRQDRRSREVYEVWHRSLGFEGDAKQPWHRLIQGHLDAERDIVGRRVLEIGAGRGELSHWLMSLERPPRLLVAADFALSAVSIGRSSGIRHGDRGLSWLVADIAGIACADAVFDTVISCETVEHIPAPGRALAELARVLKPGGRLYLTTPNYLNVSGLYRAYLRLRGRRFQEAGQPVNNLMLLPVTSVLVRRAGLRVLRVSGSGHQLLWPGRDPIQLRPPESWHAWTRWFALHSLVIGEKAHT